MTEPTVHMYWGQNSSSLYNWLWRP